MKKALIIISLLFIAAANAGCGENVPTDTPPAPPTGNGGFNFIFKYGVSAKNVLDTFQGTFTKDMIEDPSITIDLRLTDEEKDVIYQKMIEIDFFNYPDRFMVNVAYGQPTQSVTPFDIYQFVVEKDSQVKRLDWDDRILNPDVKAEKLRELIDLIRGIIEIKPEYKQLPEPRGGYL